MQCTLAASDSPAGKAPDIGREFYISGAGLRTTLAALACCSLNQHGSRSTFRDWASERTNYPRDVTEMALAHAIGDKVEAAYRRGDLFEKRQRMMADWAIFCSRPKTGSEVVRMRSRAV
jgi:hypothetical protein